MAKSQNERVYDYINEHGSITQREALSLGIYRLASRISDLKKAGCCIKSELKTVTNVDGSKARIAVYSWLVANGGQETNNDS